MTDMVTVDIQTLNPVCIGVDVGKIHDPTALAVVEVSQAHTGKFRTGPAYRQPAHIDAAGQFHPTVDAQEVMRSEYTIRHIRRVPLNTSYPEVALLLADLLCSDLFAHRDVRCLPDVTGVGRPVYDDLCKEIMLRKQGLATWINGVLTVGKGIGRIQIKPITFSHGEKYNRATGVLAKAFLVSRLQSLLQAGRVHGPDTKEMAATLEELKVYEIKVSDDGADQYGAFKTGTHDDLATALGLSCLEDPFSERVTYSQRVY
jgi:hypothetical protein